MPPYETSQPTPTKLKQEVQERMLTAKTEEQSYYDHLGGKCLCALCNCGKHKCHGQYCTHKPSMHPNQSQYMREFVPKSSDTFRSLNKNIFQQPKTDGQIGNKSTYKHDFPGYQSKADFAKNQQKLTVSGCQFSGMSTYNNMFLNWGIGDTPQFIPQNHPTVIKEMPFMGRSVYRDSYQGTPSQPAQSMKSLSKQMKQENLYKQPRSPLSPPDLKFEAESIAKSSYKPYRAKPSESEAPNRGQTGLNPSFKGQYNSEYAKEFDQKNAGVCPAKEVLDSISSK